MKNMLFSSLVKSILGFAKERSIPLLYKTTLRRWAKKNLQKLNDNLSKEIKTVYLFVDEFTNYNDTEVGIAAIKLLNKLKYKVLLVKHLPSGRTFLSKGLVRKAKKIADKNMIEKNLITFICNSININWAKLRKRLK